MLQAYTVLGVFDDALFVADTLLADAAVDAAAVDAVAVVSTAVVGVCGSFRRPTKSTKAASLAILHPTNTNACITCILCTYIIHVYMHTFSKTHCNRFCHYPTNPNICFTHILRPYISTNNTTKNKTNIVNKLVM